MCNVLKRVFMALNLFRRFHSEEGGALQLIACCVFTVLSRHSASSVTCMLHARGGHDLVVVCSRHSLSLSDYQVCAYYHYPVLPRPLTLATITTRAGLWNLGLCYERGVGVAQDPIAAQALQQQCRDRERMQSQAKRGGGPPPSIAGGSTADGQPDHYPRRSSEPSAPSVVPPRLDNSNNHSNGGNYNDTIQNSNDRTHERRLSSRRRSSSLPFTTPPPPEGPPPFALTRGNLEMAAREAVPESVQGPVLGIIQEPGDAASRYEGVGVWACS